MARIGAGGMGAVYRAEHTLLKKTVAVKVIDAGAAGWGSSSDDEDRVRLEAQVLAKLAHPNVVSVLDLDFTHDGRLCIVMELLEGESLNDRLRRGGPMPPSVALPIIRAVLRGLGHAHEMGIVHRDIKPANVFLTRHPGGGETVKILDFGLAKLVGATAEVVPVHRPTKEGTALGTPHFFSPEQALGTGIDHRTDLYAAGATLFRMLTGEYVFRGVKEIHEIIRAHVSVPPPLASARSRFAIAEDLDRAILRALAKEPNERFASAAEFEQELARLEPAPAPVHPEGSGAPPANVQRTFTMPPALRLVALALGLSAGLIGALEAVAAVRSRVTLGSGTRMEGKP